MKIQSCTKHDDGYIRWSKGEMCPICKLQAENERLRGLLKFADAELDPIPDVVSAKRFIDYALNPKPKENKL